MPSTTLQPPNEPTLYVPDTKAHNAIIFGTIATLLTTVGIIIAGATLRIAHQNRQTEHHHEHPAEEPEGIELNFIEGNEV
ncbi:hypothetical protein SLS60_005781 [Paraconiothyrium brasiliense]|uniref:Uncharacterized protein n=1 Tax=Paraconiothyrium brasiliense TaxID=300254 RepID=A0ABR3RD61_9PLEO